MLSCWTPGCSGNRHRTTPVLWESDALANGRCHALAVDALGAAGALANGRAKGR